MKELLKPLAVAALSLAMLAPAQAGDNSCRGTISVDKNWVYVVDHPSHDAAPPCKAKLNSPIGRRILAVCPEGSSCVVEMPLEGRTQDRNGTILKVEFVSNDDVALAAHEIVRHKKCGIAVSEDRLQQIKALDQRFSVQLADEIKSSTKFANSYADFCK